MQELLVKYEQLMEKYVKLKNDYDKLKNSKDDINPNMIEYSNTNYPIQLPKTGEGKKKDVIMPHA